MRIDFAVKVFFIGKQDVERSVDSGVAEVFYPFVENGEHTTDAEKLGDERLRPQHPARIAVYDDASAAPRVVIVEPKSVRDYLEEITLQVSQLAQQQGSTIPFMVIREIVENLIHAYFNQPTISILNHGNTIRFSDQGPGIKQKQLAMQYGTSSATEEMRRYIRGVGSGLPYVKQYMADKGGSLHIEDNMAGGTVVTISTAASTNPYGSQQSPTEPYPAWQQPQQAPIQPQPYYAQQYPGQPYPPQPYPNQPYPQQQWGAWQQPAYGWQQPSMPQQPYGAQPNWQQQSQQFGQQQYGQQPNQYLQQPPQQPNSPQEPSLQEPTTENPANAMPWVTLSDRGKQVIDYLRTHESVGPSDLARTLGGSQPTWSRELAALESQGLILKEGQKRRLTGMGRAYLDSH